MFRSHNRLGWGGLSIKNIVCGGGEIRTRGALADAPVFKTGALNHYATPPINFSNFLSVFPAIYSTIFLN